ncbi:MAG: hypothetical protein QM594_16355 [Niabella sp.]
MKKEDVTKEQITHLLLVILGAASEGIDEVNFDEKLKKKMKFQHKTDVKRYRACIDLIEDTDHALKNAFRFQLGDMGNKKIDFGERYLRLYGILNATYLQIGAYKELSKLINYPTSDRLGELFHVLDIYRLRNIAASHTIDYLFDKEMKKTKTFQRKTTSFRIVQMKLDRIGKNIMAIDENGVSFEFCLLDCLTDYEKVARNLLYKMVDHAIANLVSNKKYKVELKSNLDDLFSKLPDYKKFDKNSRILQRRDRQFKKVVDKTTAYINDTNSS